MTPDTHIPQATTDQEFVTLDVVTDVYPPEQRGIRYYYRTIRLPAAWLLPDAERPDQPPLTS